VDTERRQWLEMLAAACERVLARRGGQDSSNALYARLLEDVEGLLDRIRGELRASDRER